MASRGGKALLGSALVLAWACAKATDSDLGGASYDPHAAGNSGHGASGGRATGGTGTGGTGGSGAVSNGGKAGTGTGGSGTGGSATGGTGTGGGNANGGTGNGSGSGGTAVGTGGAHSEGGQAGDDGIPPDVLARAKVVLHYSAHAHSATSTEVEAYLYLENKADDPLDLSHTLVRYWTTLETDYQGLKCYFATPTMGNAANVELALVDAGKRTHVDISFKSGQLAAHHDVRDTLFQMKFDQMGGTFDQSNDWSYDGTLTDETNPAPNAKITVYLADKLIWGCEPGGPCAGEGGEGGQGGEAGQAGAGGQGGEPATSAGQGGVPNAGQGGA